MTLDPALIPPLMTVPVLVGLQIALAPRYAVARLCSTGTSARLCRALRLPWGVTDLMISLPAGGLAKLTITKVLTADEVEAIAEWYETEGLDRFPQGQTTYLLARKEPKP